MSTVNKISVHSEKGGGKRAVFTDHVIQSDISAPKRKPAQFQSGSVLPTVQFSGGMGDFINQFQAMFARWRQASPGLEGSSLFICF